MKHYYVLMLLYCPHCLMGPFLHQPLWYTLTLQGWSFSLIRFLGFFFFFFFNNCSGASFFKAHHFIWGRSWGRSWLTSQGHSNLKAVTADVAQLQLCVKALGWVDGAEGEQLPCLWLVQSCRSRCTSCCSILLAWWVVKGKPVGLAAHHKKYRRSFMVGWRACSQASAREIGSYSGQK